MLPGDLDIYWVITEIQDLVVPLNPTSLVTFPDDPTYVVANAGNNTFPGMINDRSINYEPTTASNGLKIITYRTYFDLPNLSTTTNGYSLAFKMSADDAVDNVKLNGTEKAKYLDANYNNIPGVNKPYLLSIPVCDTSFRPGQNFIDVTIADAGGAIGFYAAITLSETNGACTSEVGIREYDKQGSAFSIYPNPANAGLTIRLNYPHSANLEKTMALKIFSVDGKLIKSERVATSELESYMVNISNLSQGLYYLNISSGSYFQNLKFIRE